MNLSKLLHTSNGKIIISILLGFGLATLFRTVCKGKECIIVKAPEFEEINGKIFKQDGKCYQYKTEGKKCDSTKQIVEA
jgi:hypothetical protein